MRVAPAFQLYRTVKNDVVWWRMISPNGRGIAKNAIPFSSIEAARESIDRLVRSMDDLTTTMRVTDSYRWRWILWLDGEPFAQSAVDLDRRVRCEQAWRKFVLLAPLAPIAPNVQFFGPGPGAATARMSDAAPPGQRPLGERPLRVREHRGDVAHLRGGARRVPRPIVLEPESVEPDVGDVLEAVDRQQRELDGT